MRYTPRRLRQKQPDNEPSSLTLRLSVDPGDYAITMPTGADVTIRRCVRAAGDPTWSSGATVAVRGGEFTVGAVDGRNLLLDIVVSSEGRVDAVAVEKIETEEETEEELEEETDEEDDEEEELEEELDGDVLAFIAEID